MSSFRPPVGYEATPYWPSLYWEPFTPGLNPYNLARDFSHSLYYPSDIWRFTLLWLSVFSLFVYIPAGFWAFFTLAKSRTLKWYILPMVPICIFVLGGLIGAVFGSFTGVAIAYVYNAGFFVTSTWIPFVWAFIHIQTMLIGSLSTVTSIL